MRVNFNPNKDKELEKDKSNHRIIIPIYIPHFEGYFKDVFTIFQLCFKSLKKTVYAETKITIINNGSCSEVVEYLNALYQNNEVNELIHTEQIGKLKSILKGIEGITEGIVTITDADVFFKNGWLTDTIKVFNSFPKASVVGVVPQFNLFRTLSSNTLFDNLFNSRLKFTDVKNPYGLIHFYKSIGWKNDYNKNYLKKYLTISAKNNIRAVIGSGHFVATYRSEVFKKLPKEIPNFLLGGSTERKFLDEPALKIGAWRLTTEDNLAYHMGNVFEPWMEDELNKLTAENNTNNITLVQFQGKTNKLSFFLKNKIFKKILAIKKVEKLFLRYKHLPKEMIDGY